MINGGWSRKSNFAKKEKKLDFARRLLTNFLVYIIIKSYSFNILYRVCKNFANTIPTILEGITHAVSRPLFIALLVPVSGGLLCTIFLKERWKSLRCCVAGFDSEYSSVLYDGFYIFPLYFLLNQEKLQGMDLYYAVFLILDIAPIQFFGVFRMPPVSVWQIAASTQILLVIGLLTDGAKQDFWYFRTRQTIHTETVSTDEA